MQIKTIVGEECITTRSLWEEVFSEDSEKFLDYYYSWKAPQNIGYVIGNEPYEAMMFRTPYELQILDKKRKISYLVAVATKKEFRHKGYMTALLREAFYQMYKEKNPFTFLMPANPAIYEPFDFSYIYERELWGVNKEWIRELEECWKKKNKSEDSIREDFISELKAAQYSPTSSDLLEQWEKKNRCVLNSLKQICSINEKKEILQKITEFANNWLADRYQIYVSRSKEYYERQLEELIAQNGDIFIAKGREGIEGVFFYAREEEDLSIQEVMEKREGLFSFLQKQEKKKPIIMARIIHVEEMLKLVKSKKRRTLLIEIEDPFIPQNEGIYRVEMTSKGSLVTKLKEYREPEESWHIRDLAPEILQRVFLNEIV